MTSRTSKVDRSVWVLAAMAVLVQVISLGGYGYFRDELYYLVNGRNLGFGYVEHPPFIALVAFIVERVFGHSVVAIRLVPALASGVTVWLSGRIAAELGAQRYGQGLASLAALVTPIYLGLFSVFTMNALDIVFWGACWLILIRLLRTGDERLWLLFGVVAGLGLENKISVLFLGAGVAGGVVLLRRWEWLASRWLWLGGATAALLAAPFAVWQALHGWPLLEFMRNARKSKNVSLSPASFLLAQVGDVLGPVVALLAMAGLIYLLFARRAAPFRLAGVAFLIVIGVMIAAGDAKPYYMAPAYVVLLAAAGAGVESWLTGTVPRIGLVAILLAWGAWVAPLATPILPVETYVRYAAASGMRPGSDERHELGRLPQFFADMHGWPGLAAAVTRAYESLPPEERAAACVFTGNYGEAGAIEVLMPNHPPVLSGHNQYHVWGPRGCTGAVIIAVGGSREELEKVSSSVELAGTHTCGDCMPYENNKPIWIARGLRTPLASLWPALKHFE